MTTLTFIGGLVLTVLGFLFGRIFNQSELILSDKRRVYEDFLKKCPAPDEAYLDWSDESEGHPMNRLQEIKAPLLLYASPSVALAVGEYIQAFGEADVTLSPNSEPLHPAFKRAAQAQNDVILEMRRDAFAWSAFAHRAPTRLPRDTLEKAKRLTE